DMPARDHEESQKCPAAEHRQARIRARPLRIVSETPASPQAKNEAARPVHSRRRVSPQSDRKSTRLNSSHASSSYAVFCLKKKTRTTRTETEIKRWRHRNSVSRLQIIWTCGSRTRIVETAYIRGKRLRRTQRMRRMDTNSA